MDINRIYDFINRSIETDSPVFTDFMDLAELVQFRNRIKVPSELVCVEYNAFHDDERRMIGFIPRSYLEFMDKDGIRSLFPVVVLCIHKRFYQEPMFDHRGVLGALLGMSLERRMFGDILISGDNGYVLVHERIAALVKKEIIQIGQVAVDVEVTHEDTKNMVPSFIPINFTVSSMRLDNIVKGLVGLSRTVANRFIQTGLIKVNQIEIYKNHYEVKEEDILSIRGKGKFKIVRIGNVSKKGRLAIEAKKYT